MLMNGKSNGTKALGLRTNVATASKVTPLPAPVADPPVKTEPDYTDLTGDNVRLDVTGDILTITVDLRKDYGLSASGKTRAVASTRGWTAIATHRGVSVGMNVIRK